MKKIIWKLSLYSSRPAIAASIAISAIVMAFIFNYIQSQLWWGFISTDLLIIGTIDAVLICFVLIPAFIYLITRITKLEDERKSSSKILNTERRYRLIAENVNDVVWIYDTASNRFSYVSPSAQKQSGYTAEELLGMGLADILTPDSFSVVQEILIRRMLPVLTDDRPDNYVLELRHRHKDGYEQWIEVNAHFIQNSDTGSAEILGVSRDINERKRVSNALKESEEKFSRVFHDMPMILLINCVETGKIFDVNECMLELSGYSREELIGRNSSEIGWFKEEDRQSIYEEINKNGLVNNKELNFFTKQGTVLVGEYFARLITIAGKPYLLSIIRDITEKKKIDEELIRAKEKAVHGEKIKSDFLTQMSHEIRTPVSSVLSLTNLLYEELRDKVTEDMTDVLGMITDSGKRIIRTIDMILNMSEILSDTYEYKPRSISLHKVISPIVSEYRTAAEAKGLSLNVKNTIDFGLVTADEYSLSQIIIQLVDNAVKFTERGGVSVTIAKKDSDAFITISDTGCGISKDYLNNLFEPFSQETQGYTRKYDGNGLGLALVRRFCDLNNISLEVESEKNNGSRFILKIPVN
ncbi:MAG: PAS domain S-box protein [Syntrophothermus sp.]